MECSHLNGLTQCVSVSFVCVASMYFEHSVKVSLVTRSECATCTRTASMSSTSDGAKVICTRNNFFSLSPLLSPVKCPARWKVFYKDSFPRLRQSQCLDRVNLTRTTDSGLSVTCIMSSYNVIFVFLFGSSSSWLLLLLLTSSAKSLPLSTKPCLQSIE